MAPHNSAHNRLSQVLNGLDTSPRTIGTLTLGAITYEVPVSESPSRLPRLRQLLDLQGSMNTENLYFMLQKYLLGQDIFILSQPGPYARRLAMTFARLINAEYEYIALHRDVGETELKQGREIRSGGNLHYVDSPAVRAVKHGRLLIIEGIEKAERGIMPILNNLLENREMNLDDGSHIIHQQHYLKLSIETIKEGRFIAAHRNFRVIAIAAPVPPYPGYPLDPPFRSRFQARFVDPVGALQALVAEEPLKNFVHAKLRDIILATQYASESRNALEVVSRSSLPPFPQTAVVKLAALFRTFPPSPHISPGHLGRLFLALHPGLIHAPFQAWAMLSRQVSDAGLDELGSPADADETDGTGLLGYALEKIERTGELEARVTFSGYQPVSVIVPAGPKPFKSYPFQDVEHLDFRTTERFLGLLTGMIQAHALGWDISLIPPALPSTASCSTSTLVRVFSQLLGYEADVVHMYKELGGRELLMRREILTDGATQWEPSTIIQGSQHGLLVHLSGLDVIGATAGAISRLTQDREVELWEGRRIVADASFEELAAGELLTTHPSFRIIATASKSLQSKDWLSEEHANMFFTLPTLPMGNNEESVLLLSTGCPPEVVQTLIEFASKYRQSLSADTVQKNRRLGTRSLVRISKRIVRSPEESQSLYVLLSRSLLAEFLPAVERMNLDTLLKESGIHYRTPMFNPSPEVRSDILFFPSSTGSPGQTSETSIPRFDASADPDGVLSLVPHMEHFYDNSLQTGLMRDLAIDMEILGDHLVLLGNQGVGKNKIIDRLCQLLGRPREYIQLHRDTTVNQLMFTTSLEGGIIKRTDSPLLRAIIHGRIMIIDEADKAPEHVVAVFRSLAGQGELTLGDGRRVRRVKERDGDLVTHPNFRLVLLANRPGYPFLGNHFLQVLGDNFSCHSVSNPDSASEIRLLSQLAPDLDEDILKRLVAAFQDLRLGYDNGTLSYPYSLRELINLVRHMMAYPDDPLGSSLRNIFDFDVYKLETIDKLVEILTHHGLDAQYLGLDGAREATKKQQIDVKFEPRGDDGLDKPKHGEDDPKGEAHQGGNRWSGGTGGRDTAGLGGRGGYKRLFLGHDIKQISDKKKQEVPEHIREQAREMARQELERRLEELNMSVYDARGYGRILSAVETHIASLHDLLEHLAAKEEERVWIKRQTDGELDDQRLVDGLTGEATVYKRRGMEKPELGRPQLKPKRIRFVFDVSGSMYRFQYDGRLQRSMETASMLMESFNRLTRKEKYAWDMYGHSGDGPSIELVTLDKPPTEIGDRWKVVEKMNMVTQYAFGGDYTIEAIEKAVDEVAKFDADDWFVIAITDANFGRYQITADELTRAMNRNIKVHTALICIGEGAETSWIPKALPGRAFQVKNTSDIPVVLRSILASLIDR